MKAKKRSGRMAFILCLAVAPIFFIPILMMILGSFKTQGKRCAWILAFRKNLCLTITGML